MATNVPDGKAAAHRHTALQVTERWMMRLESFLLLLAAVAIVGMMVLITVNALGRYALNAPIHGTNEVITLYLMGIIVWFSMAQTEHENRHVQIDLIARRLPQQVQRVLRILSLVLSSLVVGIILYAVWWKMLDNWGRTMVGAIPFPLGLSWLVILVGASVLILRMMIKIAAELCGVDTTQDRQDAATRV